MLRRCHLRPFSFLLLIVPVTVYALPYNEDQSLDTNLAHIRFNLRDIGLQGERSVGWSYLVERSEEETKRQNWYNTGNEPIDDHIALLRRRNLAEVQAAIQEAVGWESRNAQNKRRRTHSTRHDRTDEELMAYEGDSHVDSGDPGRDDPESSLAESDEDDEEDADNAFLAPPSIAAKSNKMPKLQSVEPSIATTSTTLAKTVLPTTPTGLHRALQTAGTNADVDHIANKHLDSNPEAIIEDNLTARSLPIIVANTPIGGTSGAIELISNLDNAHLGSLGATPTPSNMLSHSGISFDYLFDAVTQTAERTMFYMDQHADQSLVRNQMLADSDYPAAQDWLVSLRTHLDNGLFCATFDPHAPYVHSFDLTPCVSENVAGIGGQAFRYSPGTGVIRPVYSIDRADADLDMEYLDMMDSLDSSGTFVDAPLTTPFYVSPFDDLAKPTVQTNQSLPSLEDPWTLVNQPVLDLPRTLVIGDESFSGSMVDRDASHDSEVRGALMVFSRIFDHPEVDQDLPKIFDTIPAGGAVSEHSEPQHKMLVRREMTTGSSRPDPQNTMSSATEVKTKASDGSVAKSESTYFEPVSTASPQVPSSTLRNSDKHFGTSMDNMPIPKPVVNVAYFPNSGRSPPVPPEAQAASGRAIMLAMASKNLEPASVASADSDVVPVWLAGPQVLSKNHIMSAAGSHAGDSTSSPQLPVDASD